LDHILASDKDFREAWILLLLRGHASYGYELRRELRCRSLDLDPAVMYRSLREMERANLIASGWSRSDAGPPRRVYELTGDGHAELERRAAAIGEARDAHDVFLAAFASGAAGTGGASPA
jgi:PadR family transcriptional regulator PadR